MACSIVSAWQDELGPEIVSVHKEKAFDAKTDRFERKKVLALAQTREIDAILVTELSRWGRSTIDLVQTLKSLQAWDVSVLAISGLQFDFSTLHGKMIASVMQSSSVTSFASASSLASPRLRPAERS